jgi:hypothetical protein
MEPNLPIRPCGDGLGVVSKVFLAVLQVELFGHCVVGFAIKPYFS